MSTDNDQTAAWLNETLLLRDVDDGHDVASATPWWKMTGRQSKRGILMKVKYGSSRNDVWNEVTEILLYASVTGSHDSLPSPPGSSSPAPSGENVNPDPFGAAQQINVYALPLSSKIIEHATECTSRVTPPPEGAATQARFLPRPAIPTVTDGARQQKRQSLSSMFDDATHKRRKTKGRGGESVAQVMAGFDRPTSQQGPQPFERIESQDTPAVPMKSKAPRAGLKRANTVIGSEVNRPTSVSGYLAQGKRSSLHRVESAISPRESPTLSDSDAIIAQQNKSALTKVVMAGMRLYGLQQKKKPSKTISNVPPSVAELTITDDGADEYKLVYHQTFKAACFAFRKHLGEEVIGLEAMRDIVDRLLSIFCVDL